MKRPENAQPEDSRNRRQNMTDFVNTSNPMIKQQRARNVRVQRIRPGLCEDKSERTDRVGKRSARAGKADLEP